MNADQVVIREDVGIMNDETERLRGFLFEYGFDTKYTEGSYSRDAKLEVEDFPVQINVTPDLEYFIIDHGSVGNETTNQNPLDDEWLVLHYLENY